MYIGLVHSCACLWYVCIPKKSPLSVTIRRVLDDGAFISPLLGERAFVPKLVTLSRKKC